jgi:hypothetical protein
MRARKSPDFIRESSSESDDFFIVAFEDLRQIFDPDQRFRHVGSLAKGLGGRTAHRP